jgi:hypothetical protein
VPVWSDLAAKERQTIDPGKQFGGKKSTWEAKEQILRLLCFQIDGSGFLKILVDMCVLMVCIKSSKSPNNEDVGCSELASDLCASFVDLWWPRFICISSFSFFSHLEVLIVPCYFYYATSQVRGKKSTWEAKEQILCFQIYGSGLLKIVVNMCLNDLS